MRKLLKLKTKVKEAERTIDVVLHDAPHFEEILARWEVKMLAGSGFLLKYSRQGVLEIGCGDGPFNEHPRNGNKGKEGECAATLIAKALGVEDEQPLKLLLNYARFNDTHKRRDPKNPQPEEHHHPLEPANLVKMLHEQLPEKPEEVIRRIERDIIEPVFLHEWKLFKKTGPEFEKGSQTEKIPGPEGKQLTLVTVTSDNEQMLKYALSKFGGRADVIIQRRLSDQTQIFTSQRAMLNLDDTVGIIRLEEQAAKERMGKGRLVTTDWGRLHSEGEVSGAEEWYYFPQGRMLLNGSLSYPDVPPTKLSLGRIKGLVKIGLNPKAFESSRAGVCRTGRCTNTREFPCPWYRWGLHRCRLIRFETKSRQSGKQSRK